MKTDNVARFSMYINIEGTNVERVAAKINEACKLNHIKADVEYEETHTTYTYDFSECEIDNRDINTTWLHAGEYSFEITRDMIAERRSMIPTFSDTHDDTDVYLELTSDDLIEILLNMQENNEN